MHIKLVVALICVTAACSNQKTNTSDTENIKGKQALEGARWLIGSWYDRSEGRTTYEVWKKYNDTTYIGRSYTIQEGDTLSSEYIKLVQDGNEVNYIPVVQGQNMGMPITFKMIFMGEDKLVFENQAHDFPQRIAYRRLSSDSLIAEISGVIKGAYHEKKFSMRKAE